MRRILLGTSIWGEHHLRMFTNWCLPSLMAPGNLPALLSDREVHFHIYTTADLEEPIRQHIPFSIQTRFTIIDPPVGNKYLHLARMQQNQLRYAKETGADYHLLMPDFIYSRNCFAGILRAARWHKAIARLVMSTRMETMTSALREYCRGKTTLSIPHADLATYALLNIHPGCKNWLARKNEYPNIHVQVFEGKDIIRMLSPHLSPVYIASKAIKPIEILAAMDSQLDKITDEPWYCPKLRDGIGIIEITPALGREENSRRVDLKEFCRIMKVDSNEAHAQRVIFNEETVDPLNLSLMSQERKYWSSAAITEEINAINRELDK